MRSIFFKSQIQSVVIFLLIFSITKLNSQVKSNPIGVIDPYKVQIHTLKNGMKLYMSVSKDAPKIQTMIAVKAGSKNDPSDATGLAHYLEHMLFKGTDKFGTNDFASEQKLLIKIENLFEIYRKTKDDLKRKKIYSEIDSLSGLASKLAIANEYDKMTASIGCTNTNAFTSFDQTVYINEIPSNQLENWLDIEAERFRKPVLRLFHTELEAVYEEKNRSLDNENSKVWEKVFSSLFKNHTYGTQTTIGTIEHLKNPSMKEIREYYTKNYVPNNMAIILAGDFDPSKAIQAVEKKFGYLKTAPLSKYTFQPEKKIEKPIEEIVLGPNAESVTLAFRFNGFGSRDADMIKIVNLILSNGKAGLMDLNLVQAQKVISASGFDFNMKDYSIHGFFGMPKENQKLEEVKDLILSQIQEIKNGQFPDWILPAVITDLKYQQTKKLEDNYSRANEMLDAFSNEINWEKQANQIERLSKIKKEEIIKFVRENYKENYVVVYKRKGEDKSVMKVDKPSITPVSVNREQQSAFLQQIVNFKPNNLDPVFLNYEKDIRKEVLGKNLPLLYKQNLENNTFDLYYFFNVGSNHDKLLPLAIQYLPFLGTDKLSAKEIQQEFYKLGCSFNVFTSQDQTYLSLNGLTDNFKPAVEIVESLLANPRVDETAFQNLILDVLKQREDAKLNKSTILREALFNYALFGPENPFTFKLTNDELKKLNPEDLIGKIKEMNSYEHQIFYYGSDEINEVKSILAANHSLPDNFVNLEASNSFNELETEGKVLVVEYDMKQAEILMIHKGEKYDPSISSKLAVYNEYFGGGMSGIVFQEMRESKALAYSVNSVYRQPNRKEKPYILSSYIGTQADKLPEALNGMSDLLKNMPFSESNLKISKESLLSGIRSERINRIQVLLNYDRAQKLGLNYDIREKMYNEIPKITLEDLREFQEKYVKERPMCILVIGKRENLDLTALQKYGSIQFVGLKEIFGF